MKAPRLRVNSSRRANQELSYHNICSLLIIFRKRGYLHQAGLEMGKVRRKSGSQNTSWEVMQWLKHLSNRKLNRKVMWINNHLLFGPKVVLKYMYVSSWSFCIGIFLQICKLEKWKLNKQVNVSWVDYNWSFFCSKPSHCF